MLLVVNNKKPIKGQPRGRKRVIGDAYQAAVKRGEELKINGIRAEVAMWVAVITQAVQDALSRSTSTEMVYHKGQAVIWLTRRSQGLADVCEMAYLDMDYVITKATYAIENEVKWRADAGDGVRYHERKNYRLRRKQMGKERYGLDLPQ